MAITRTIRALSLLAFSSTLLASTAGSTTASAADANTFRLFAVVDGSGALQSGSGVVSATHVGAGQYEVTFATDVSSCAYVATTTNAYDEALVAFTAGGHLSSDGVYVETRTQEGIPMDAPFNLIVACTGFAISYAVVGYAADLVRATPGTILRPRGQGRYDLRFVGVTAACAFVAAVGDPGNNVVPFSAGVYTATGPSPSNGTIPDARTVYVETKNPGGGLQGGVPFHLAVVCPWTPHTRTAVVQADGVMHRGSLFTSSFRSDTGRYTVVTTRPISQCAAVATRGEPVREVPYTPATVEVVPGPAPNTVGLEVRQLLFFGGAFLDEDVHVAVVC